MTAEKSSGSLGMRIHYTNPSPLPDDVADGAIYHGDALDLLRVSAFLSLHAPATPATRHFLNADTLALLPPGAIIVNTARGDLIRDEDLLAALAAGSVAAIGMLALDNVDAVLSGRPAPTLVTPPE
jgi:lactate dehydrogenase-like 2-hydroxyacid dehydrogenase